MSACLARVEQHSLVGAGHDARRRLGARVDPESAAALAPVREALLGNRDHLVRQRALVQAEPGMPPPLTESLEDLLDQAEVLRQAEQAAT